MDLSSPLNWLTLRKKLLPKNFSYFLIPFSKWKAFSHPFQRTTLLAHPKKKFLPEKFLILTQRTDFLLKEKFLILAWKRNQFLTVTRKTISQTKSFLYLSEKIISCPHQSNFLNKKIFTLIWKNRFSSTLTWRGRNLIIHSVLMLSYSYCLTVTFGIHSIVIAFLLVPYYHCLIYTVISIAFYCFVIHSVLIFFFFFAFLLEVIRQPKEVFRIVRVDKLFRYFL